MWSMIHSCRGQSLISVFAKDLRTFPTKQQKKRMHLSAV